MLRAVEKGRTKPISAVHAFFVVCKFSTRFACRQVCKNERSGFVRAFSQEVAKVYLPTCVSTLNCNIRAEFFSGAPLCAKKKQLPSYLIPNLYMMHLKLKSPK